MHSDITHEPHLPPNPCQIPTPSHQIASLYLPPPILQNVHQHLHPPHHPPPGPNPHPTPLPPPLHLLALNPLPLPLPPIQPKPQLPRLSLLPALPHNPIRRLLRPPHWLPQVQRRHFELRGREAPRHNLPSRWLSCNPSDPRRRGRRG